MKLTHHRLGHRPASFDVATRQRARRGWAALMVSAVLCTCAMVGSAQTSHADETGFDQEFIDAYAVNGFVPVDNAGPGVKVPKTWVFPGTPEITYSDGPRSPSVEGYNVAGYAPVLNFADTHTKTKAIGYCLEPGVIGSSDMYNMISPKEYLSGNRGEPGRTAAENMGKITWIVQNSYPAVDAATFARISGISTTNHYDLYNGTQAAIWHYTHGLALVGGSPWTVDIYKWLVSRAKEVPLAGSSTTHVTVDAASARQRAVGNHSLFGPITVKASNNVTQLKVAGGLPQGATVTDAAGAELPGTLRQGGAEVYLKLPPGTSAQTAQLSVTGQAASIENGMILVGKDSFGHGKSQARILSGQPLTKQVSSAAQVSWAAVAGQPSALDEPTVPRPAVKPKPKPVTPDLPATTPPPSQPEMPVAEKPRPQDPSLPKTGVDSRQTWRTALLGLSAVFLGCGVLMLVRQPKPRPRRH